MNMAGSPTRSRRIQMAKIISLHSYRGGTGKSNLTANVTALLAQSGQRVGVIDTDIQSPGIHILFGLTEDSMTYALNDYLWGRCEIEQAAYDVTPPFVPPGRGRVYLIPSSLQVGEITHVLKEGFDPGLLTDGYERLLGALSLDVLMIDTHPGLNEETLLSIAISDVLGIVLRPDQQDYLGTSVTVEVAKRLGVPRLLLVINKVPAVFDMEAVRNQALEAYGCEVAAIFPHSEEMMVLGSQGLFVVPFPDHPLTTMLRKLAEQLVA
jgi:MinD-like ATPase involved in chromosome partitioning or flagellar assembly